MGTSLFEKYPKGHDFGGARVLNVGCGFVQFKLPNVVNVDAFDICNPDVVWDLNKTPFPFKDGEFDFVMCNHILEHLPNWWGAFNECARLTKVGGIVEVWVPHIGSDSALGYRDHVVGINNCSFYGTFGTYRPQGNAWSKANLLCPANNLLLMENNFRVENIPWLKHAPKCVKQFAVNHLRNVVNESGFIFRKLSDEQVKKEMEKYNGKK